MSDTQQNTTSKVELLCEWTCGPTEIALFVKTVDANTADLYEVGSTWTNNDTGLSYKILGLRPA